MVNKFLYWIKGFNPGVQRKRKCHRFCVRCEYYDLCKNEMKEK